MVYEYGMQSTPDETALKQATHPKGQITPIARARITRGGIEEITARAQEYENHGVAKVSVSYEPLRGFTVLQGRIISATVNYHQKIDFIREPRNANIEYANMMLERNDMFLARADVIGWTVKGDADNLIVGDLYVRKQQVQQEKTNHGTCHCIACE